MGELDEVLTQLEMELDKNNTITLSCNLRDCLVSSGVVPLVIKSILICIVVFLNPNSI